MIILDLKDCIQEGKKMKKRIKDVVAVFAVFGLFASAIVLNGVLTCEHFEWWMIPTGAISGAYLIGAVAIGYIKARKGEW